MIDIVFVAFFIIGCLEPFRERQPGVVEGRPRVVIGGLPRVMVYKVGRTVVVPCLLPSIRQCVSDEVPMPILILRFFPPVNQRAEFFKPFFGFPRRLPRILV